MGYQTWSCWSNLSILVFKERKENKKQEIICSRLVGALQTPHSSASKELASLHSGANKESWALRDSLQKQATVSRVLYHFCFGLFTSFEHGCLLPASNLPMMKASPSEDEGSCTCLFIPSFPPAASMLQWKGTGCPACWLGTDPVRPCALWAMGGRGPAKI